MEQLSSYWAQALAAYAESPQNFHIAGACLAVTMVGLLFKKAMYGPWVFDPKVIDKVGKKAVKQKKTLEERLDFIRDELSKEYPGKILQSREWAMYNSGGAKGAMFLLYCSTWEYVMVNGSAIGFTALTGRHLVEFHDVVIDGEVWYFHENTPHVKETYKEGDFVFMGAGTAMGTAAPDNFWLLEYARGPIPSLMMFGFWDIFFSTLDFYTLFRTMYVYGKAQIHAMFH